MAASRLEARKGRKASQRGRLTTADLIVLSLLAERAMHGYELAAEYERQEVADWASVSKAQVYYAIHKLAELRMIEPVDVAARDRTVYRPTAAGRSELASALKAVDWASTRVPQPFTTWLGLSIHLPRSAVVKMLKAREQFLRAELERERASLVYIEELTSDRARAGEEIVGLVIRQIEAELAWIATLQKRRAL